jgi:hypothetical protein
MCKQTGSFLNSLQERANISMEEVCVSARKSMKILERKARVRDTFAACAAKRSNIMSAVLPSIALRLALP